MSGLRIKPKKKGNQDDESNDLNTRLSFLFLVSNEGILHKII